MNAKPLLPLLLSLLLGVPAVARDPTEVPAFAAQDEWVLQRVLRLRSDLRNTETRLEDLAEAIAEPDGLLKAAALFDKPELLDLRNRCLHVRQERDSLRAAQDGDPERLRELEA
ncbi:MAG: hypothetical protein IK066_02515 [Kiritimatiellae bacterium]|nr:hypothetical protein [Kiritimatiellia bacterium]